MAKEFDTLWGGGGGIYKDTSCAVAKAPESWRCNTINVLYPFISTPLYVAEEQYDSNQLFSQLGTPHTASGQQYEAYFGRRMRLSVEQVTGRWEPCRQRLHLPIENTADSKLLDTPPDRWPTVSEPAREMVSTFRHAKACYSPASHNLLLQCDPRDTR